MQSGQVAIGKRSDEPGDNVDRFAIALSHLELVPVDDSMLAHHFEQFDPILPAAQQLNEVARRGVLNGVEPENAREGRIARDDPAFRTNEKIGREILHHELAMTLLAVAQRFFFLSARGDVGIDLQLGRRGCRAIDGPSARHHDPRSVLPDLIQLAFPVRLFPQNHIEILRVAREIGSEKRMHVLADRLFFLPSVNAAGSVVPIRNRPAGIG